MRSAVFLAVLLFFANDLFARSAKSSKSSSSSSGRPLVVIDAGHGGFDRGGIPGQRVAEKNMALDVAQRLAKKLHGAGYRVVMTRDSDVFVSLPGRVAIANSYRHAIFVCIHFNSSTRAGANGIETYYYRKDSMTLAADIHRNVIGGAPTENRGIRRRGYYVLRKTTIPGVLVECGFLTNPGEARLVLTSSYREKLAEEISRGVQGKAALVARPPASLHYPAAVTPRQPFGSSGILGTDFVRAEPERSSRHHKSSRKKKSKKTKSSHSKKSHSSKKKSTKKKSGD